MKKFSYNVFGRKYGYFVHWIIPLFVETIKLGVDKMDGKEKRTGEKKAAELNPLIDSQTDTPSMGSWPVSPAPILDDDQEKSEYENDKE